MQFDAKVIAPPKSWEAFEDLCLALFQAVWGDDHALKHGRQGQAQAGVDVYGHKKDDDGKLWGVQCKCKGKSRTLGGKLSIKEVDAELAKADTFKPKLTHFIIATTALADTVIQEHVRTVSAERAKRGDFPVTVLDWGALMQLLAKHQAVAKDFYAEHFRDLSAPAKAPAFHLPGQYLTPHFSDPLNHLAALHQQLQASHSTALLAAATVQGMGGVGKTQLAVKYCHEYRADYAGVWWFPCDSMILLEQECQHFCQVNGIAVPNGAAASGALREWLTTQPRWLLVYDNADNAADLQALRACLPHPGAHHVLITSRLHAWAQMPALRLDVWTGEQALPFLRERLPGAHEAQLLALNKALGGLPLALEQACAFIGNNQFPLADYIARINAVEHAPAMLDEHASLQCARSVIATLSLSFGKLSAPAQALLQLCGWLAPEPIPEYLFTEKPDELPLVLQPIAGDQVKWRKTVAELHNYALCQVQDIPMVDHAGNGGTLEKCLVLHRLTQAAVRAGDDPAMRGAAAVGDGDPCKHVIGLLWAVFPNDVQPQHPKHWPRCRTLMPHVQGLAQYDARDGQRQVDYANLLNRLAIYLKVGPALPGESQRLERLALAIKQTALGEDHPETLASMSNLAATLHQQGDLPGARALHEKTLDIRIRVLGADHPDTLQSMKNLAETLRWQGDLPGARALHEKTLDIFIRVLGADHPHTLTSKQNLAYTLRDMGETSAAQALFDEVAAAKRRAATTTPPPA
jgi:hypothetical protein